MARDLRISGARCELAKGPGIGKTARLARLGVGTVHRLKREMAAGLVAAGFEEANLVTAGIGGAAAMRNEMG